MPSVPDSRYKLPNLASQAFRSQTSLALKAYLKVRLENLAWAGFPPSYNPSPTGPHIPQNRGDDLGMKPFFQIFCPCKLRSKFCIEKMTKKMLKSRVLASQNPSKTHPKAFQNRCSKKHQNFQQFFGIFSFFGYPPFFKNMHFTEYKSLFLKFSLKSCFCNCHAFSVKKTYQKPFQNEVRTLPKSMPKTCCFLTSIFTGFGHDFGGSWASKMEPSPPRCWQRQAC